MIDIDRYRRIDEIFQAALELEPHQRASYISEACSGDAALLKEVEDLLASDGQQWELIGTPAFEMVAPLLAKDQLELEAGDSIGHYQVVSLLGVGGMGQVYLAEDAKLGRKVALKLLPTTYTRDESRLRRFQQEARAASALNHPNILTIHELGEVNGEQFIATEFVEGETLRERLNRAPLNLPEILDVAVQIAGALSAAHKAGIVHRDIKPENIMLRHDGYVKVLDFGLAKLTEQPEPATQTRATENVDISSGLVMGTVKYMSPEQARGRQVDPRSDIFSFGVVLYEMIAGHPPFEGKNSNELISAILKEDPSPLTDVPEETQRLVSRALRKKKEDRYQTIEDVLADLKSLKEDTTLTKVGAQHQPGRWTGSTFSTTEVAAISTATNIESAISEIKGHKIATFVTLVLLLAGVVLSYRHFFSPRSVNAIAVMPFENDSVELEYLSDGMTDAVIESLSLLPNLNVKAGVSVFRYKGKDAATIGRELNVQAILKGRIVQHGEDLMLYLELVDAKTNNRLWGDQYTRKKIGIISLPSEVARDVADKLGVRLSGADEQRLAKNSTENVDAYQLYLKGRKHADRLTPKDLEKALEYFRQAIDLDPNYALAYVGIADANFTLTLTSNIPPAEAFPKAKAAANTALKIDPNLDAAYAIRCWVEFWYEWDWGRAEQQCNQAISLKPNNGDAHRAYAHLLSNTGRHNEALEEFKSSLEVEPLNPRTNAEEGQALLHAGRVDEALVSLQKSIELEPNIWMPRLFLASAYIEKGMYDEAVAAARKVVELSPAQTHGIAFEGYALAKSGKREEAQAALRELLDRSTKGFVSPYRIALIYNGLGDKDNALDYLERGFIARDPMMTFLKVEPKWNNLRSEPRFIEIVKKVGLE